MRSFPQAIASRHRGLCVQIPSALELMVDTAVRDSFSYSSELVFESRREVLGQPLDESAILATTCASFNVESGYI